MKKDQLKKAAVFSGLGIQMGVAIYLGYRLGQWLDVEFYKSDKFYETWCTLFAIFASIISTALRAIKIFK